MGMLEWVKDLTIDMNYVICLNKIGCMNQIFKNSS